MPDESALPTAVADPAAPSAEPLAPSWHTVVLVCRECEKRGGGPKRLTAKAVRGALKVALRGTKGQVRVVASSCLGPCPRRAVTVAALAPGQPAAVAAVRSLDEAAAFAAPIAPRR